MGKRKKLAKRVQSEGSRGFRRVASDARIRKRVLSAMKECINEVAANRPDHLRRFFATWNESVSNMDRVAECILAHRAIVLLEEDIKTLLAPYDVFQQLFFARLMDHLDAEEPQFVETARKLNGAWQKMFAATLVRHPELSGLVERMSANSAILHEEVVNLYIGEALPALTPRWAKALCAVKADFKPFAEGLRK